MYIKKMHQGVKERVGNRGIYTSFPSGEQRQKKSGRGRPTAFFIASVMTAVISTENKRPALGSYKNLH